MNIFKSIDELFLLLILINGGFMEHTLNKDYTKFIKLNKHYSHLILLFTIYFILKLNNEEKYHPIETLKQTIFIFIFYYFIMKLQIKYLFIVIILLLFIFLIDYYKKFHKNKELNHKLIKIENILLITIIIIISINIINIDNGIFTKK